MAGRISSPRFIGRTAELAFLDAVLRRAADGAGGAVLVEGEAGIGKSRLVAELEARASSADVNVLVGECLQLAEGEFAFAPIVGALRSVVAEAEVLAALDPALRSALGALWPAAGSSPPHSGDREQLFEAVYRVLVRLAVDRPVLLIIEDIHWIDPSSRDLASFVVHNARRDRLAIVTTYRIDELHRGHPTRAFLAELERSGRAERLELVGLGRADVGEQVAAITGRHPDPEMVDAIFARCEGNPFFVEELLASADTPGAGLPGSLREALLLRMERLTVQTEEMLAAAAAIGRSVDHRLLASVVSTSEEDLLGALRETAEHHVLMPTGHPATYRFRHALVREAIYEDTLAGERLRLHRAIAESLSERPELAGHVGGAAAELAHHWYAASDMPKALPALVEAAAQAAQMRAHPEALHHLERALELWNKVPSAEALVGVDRVAVLLRASEMAEHAGKDQRCLDLAREAREAVSDRANPVRGAEVEARLGAALWNAGRADDALEHLAQVIRLVPEHPPSMERAEALASYGRLVMLNAQFGRARGHLEEGLKLARALQARTVEASALNSLAIVYEQLGQRRRAIAAGRQGLAISTELADGPEMLRGYINGSQAMDNAGQLEEALILGLEGIETAHRMGLDRAGGDQLSEQAAWRLIRLGRFEEADRVIRPAFEDATLAFNVAATRNVAGHLAAVRGDFDAANELLEQAWELMQHTGSFQLIGLALAWRISLRLWQGQLEHARRLAREGLDRIGGAEGQLVYTAEVYWLAARVEADFAGRARGLGDPIEAQDAATAAESAAAALAQAIGRSPGDGAPPESLEFEALARAEVSRARGSHDPAPWQAAVERLRASGHAHHAAYAELRVAEVLALSGEPPAQVAERLRQAHAAANDLGVRPLCDEVATLARRTRVALGEEEAHAREATDQLGLSLRELEVLRLVAEGRTNRQIGCELFITDKTASAHVSHILMKLGVSNRGEAAAAAHRLGLTHQHGRAPPSAGALTDVPLRDVK